MTYYNCVKKLVNDFFFFNYGGGGGGKLLCNGGKYHVVKKITHNISEYNSNYVLHNSNIYYYLSKKLNK